MLCLVHDVVIGEMSYRIYGQGSSLRNEYPTTFADPHAPLVASPSPALGLATGAVGCMQ